MSKLAESVELIDFFKARGNTYTLLANIFLGKFDEVQTTLSVVPSERLGKVDDLTQIVKQLKETPIDELKVQYDNLFVVPASLFVPPFSAYHLSFKDEEAKEEYFMEINHYYQTFDFSLPFEKFERVDHIGYLLAFTAYVNQTTLALLEENDEENTHHSVDFQKKFLTNHLQSWIGDLEKEVSLKMNRGLILNTVRYLHQFVEWDIEELAKF